MEKGKKKIMFGKSCADGKNTDIVHHLASVFLIRELE